DENELEVIWQDGAVTLEKAGKEKLARQLIAVVEKKFHAEHPDKNH
ncbi:MAG: bifunctional 4'-phosphopantothenoylcysteine decarboxylase/phosphopantothenoylcysteine synthetase, partial [Gammaproteobacteria bacterium]|nr:bifunctional 4'-phosphopantothenoylcysteine decarboxylase/phosphopantothenoylcysteine synthetase [Gammaproteobacteria bacterium]NIW46939.1 bifunctional 4'-phosphopantothenoylcysteine decarboxylase/phosphopantothenoylcysteine synthetase [Gammaproteobacteria bacterium]NIX57947.1 bifunctional 4'-phosphopantothenoylcysteine decarboxylase/phosphopantothenoylcysteine synthetase [candidate division Zixibacteria bacterium]